MPDGASGLIKQLLEKVVKLQNECELAKQVSMCIEALKKLTVVYV
jgi:hypothetical protein